jgi:putative inorganic carbon (HCO3(-)) transporter
MEMIRKMIYFGIALIVLREFNSEEKIKRLITFLFITCFIATFYGLIQYLDGRYFPPGPTGGLDPFIWRLAFGNRIFSTFGNPNFYGDFLVVLGPILLAMYLKTKRLYLLALYILLVFNGIVTYSKGAWIGLTVGFIAFSILTFIFFAHSQKFDVKKYAPPIVAIVLIFCIVAVVYYMKQRTDSAKFRIYTWLSCWEMINTQPVLGTGVGTFYVTYPAWRRPQIFFVEGKHNTESDHPENEWLEVWYDEGTVGFAIFIWMAVMLIGGGYRGLKTFTEMTVTATDKKGKPQRPTVDPRAYYMLGFLSSFIAMLSHNFVCVSLRFVSSGVFLWLLVGLICALMIHNPLPASSADFTKMSSLKPVLPVPVKRFFEIVLIVIAWYLITIFAGFFKGDMSHNIAIYHSKRGEWSQALENYNNVAKQNYGFIMCHYFMGNVFNDRWILNRELHTEWGDKETDEHWTQIDSVGKTGRVDPERSVSKYEDVWSLAPNYVQSHHQAGLVYLKLGDMSRAQNNPAKMTEYWNKAIDQFEKYHKIDPIFAQNYYRLAWIYLQLGNQKKAEETYWRHLYTMNALFKKGNQEMEWVSQQMGEKYNPKEECEIHKGQYHCVAWEDWGRRRWHEYTETYINLANLKFIGNDFNKAELYYKKAIEIDQRNVSALKNLAILYTRSGKHNDAVILWNKIREINPQDPDVQRVFKR